MGKIQFLVFVNLMFFVHFRNLQTPHRLIVNISVNNFAEESEAIRAPRKLLQNFQNLIFGLNQGVETLLAALTEATKATVMLWMTWLFTLATYRRPPTPILFAAAESVGKIASA